MRAEEFIKLIVSMGVGGTRQAKRYVEEHPKENYDSFADIRDFTRWKPEARSHKHGYSNYGRVSGISQDVLSCTGRSGEYEADLQRFEARERAIRHGKKDGHTRNW